MTASVRLSRKTAQALLDLGRGRRGAGDFDVDCALNYLDAALTAKPKRSSLAHAKPVRAKKKTKREQTAEIYAEVEKRAGGFCEACGERFAVMDPPHMDHALPKGRYPQSKRTCWLIHGLSCHRRKHAGEPSAAFWFERFALHCDLYGYTAEAAQARGKIPAANLRKTK